MGESHVHYAEFDIRRVLSMSNCSVTHRNILHEAVFESNEIQQFEAVCDTISQNWMQCVRLDVSSTLSRRFE